MDSDDGDHYSRTTTELALRGMLAYVVIGFVFTAFHVELLDLLENRLSGQFTVFADYAALATMVLGWPVLFGTALVCGVSGCGLI